MARLPLAAKAVVVAVLVLALMNAYWRATVPGYFRGLDICAGGCHTTKILNYKKITHPLWCIECHGFGVKSELIPGLNIPRVRDHQLELMVEEHGECLMCHPVPNKFHWEHLNVTEKKLEEVGLVRPIRCTDCHTKAYHGGHTIKPGNKVCTKCHDPERLHPGMDKSLIPNCLACHGPSPVVAAAVFKPKKMSYSFVASAGFSLAMGIGKVKINVTDACLLCHRVPDNMGHLKHYEKKMSNGHIVRCEDCHAGSLLHGEAPLLESCVQCHKHPRLHDVEPEKLSDCYRCHAGFKYANTSLMPVKGCEGCHRNTYITAVKVGLHMSHVEYYACSVCHDTKAKTHKEMLAIKDPNKLCKKCHTDTGALTDKATANMTKPFIATEFGAGLQHAEMVQKAKGDCMSCHGQWHVVSKPGLFYVYLSKEKK